MNTTLSEVALTEPVLQPPGAGLPPVEARFFRHGLPLLARAISIGAARKMFLAEGQRILYLAQDLKDWDLEERVLVKRPFGVEDNSRYWSMEMLLEHLILVGTGIRSIVGQLAIGVRPNKKVRISDGKPQGGEGPDIREKYGRYLNAFVEALDNTQFPPRPTHAHPWAGEMNAAQWYKYAALHNWMHRIHAERIVAGIELS